MAMTDTRDLLKKAQDGGYAIGAFNTENMEIMQAVFEAAEETQSPFILQTTPSMLKYATPEVFFGMAYGLSKKYTVPVALHLDHGNSFSAAAMCLRAGYTSIMIDGSKLAFEENIALTKRVVDMCAPCSVPVEAELGKVGGKEEEVQTDDPGYTDPAEAEDFCQRTGISSLAVAIGTAHGIYPKGMQPELQMNILRDIAGRVDIPLVLHGGSANPDAEIAESVTLGVGKINISSDMKYAYFQKVREILAKETWWDPNVIYPEAISAARDVIRHKMKLFGSTGKASLY